MTRFIKQFLAGNTLLTVAATLCFAQAVAFAQAAGAPDFSTHVDLEPEVAGSGKIIGLLRNISDGPIRGVVMQVAHRWTWGNGGSYRYTEKIAVNDMVLPGDPAGFAAVHLPPETVPDSARYAYDLKVLELTEIRLAE